MRTALLPAASFAAIVLACPGTAQPPAARPPAPQSLVVTERFVYVLRGDEIVQLDAETLQVLRQQRLPPPLPVARGLGPTPPDADGPV